MRDVEQHMNAARSLLEVRSSPNDTERALMRFKNFERRRRKRRIATGAVGSMAAVSAALIVWATLGPSEQPIATPVAPVEQKIAEAPAEQVIYFPDGSHAYLIEPNTQIRMEALSDDLLELTMAVGAARFEVQPNPKRLFRVRTKDLRIEVLGTSFTVSAGDPTGVLVHSGRVAVYQGDNRHELGSGMSFTYDGERSVTKHKKPKVKKPAAKKKKVKKPIARAWKRLAEKGDFKAAYQAMSTSEVKPVDTKELMLAADVARLTGHPQEAAGYLLQVVERHSSHPDALLAAFTLGRIRKRELDDPAGAARAFHSAYTLAPTGSLAEDALAHEVECWALAGQKDKAKERAREYLDRYPDGRKQKLVRRIGGLL